MDDVVVPGGVIGAEIDAAVADVGVALGVQRPRGGVHVDAAAGDPLGVLRDDVVALRELSGIPRVRESISTLRSFSRTL